VFNFFQGALRGDFKDHGKIGHAVIASELIAICAEIILEATIEARPSGNVEFPRTLDFQMVVDMCIRGGANATRFVLETEDYPWPMKRVHQIGFFRAAVKHGCMFPEHQFLKSKFKEILRMMTYDPYRLRRFHYDSLLYEHDTSRGMWSRL